MNYLEVQARKQGGYASKHKETLNRTNYFVEINKNILFFNTIINFSLKKKQNKIINLNHSVFRSGFRYLKINKDGCNHKKRDV